MFLHVFYLKNCLGGMIIPNETIKIAFFQDLSCNETRGGNCRVFQTSCCSTRPWLIGQIISQGVSKERTVYYWKTCQKCRSSLQLFSKVWVCSDPTAGVLVKIEPIVLHFCLVCVNLCPPASFFKVGSQGAKYQRRVCASALFLLHHHCVVLYVAVLLFLVV